MYCLWAENGTIKWQSDNPNGESSPAVAEGKVFFGTNFEWFHCVNASTGEELWNKRIGAFTFSSPTYADGKVYFGATNNKIYCFDAEGNEYGYGVIIWTYQTSGDVYSSPAFHNERVIIGSNDGFVYCLDGEGNGDGTTTVIWSRETGASLWSSPAIADDKVYIGSDDGSIYCLNESTGDIIWTYVTGDSTGHSSPAIALEKVFIGSLDGFVYCFAGEFPPAPDLECEGELLWEDVNPGDIVTGSFEVGNIGELGSLLDWEVVSWPEWGEWAFDPDSGTDLGEGEITTVSVEIVAPEDENTEFNGEILIENIEDPEDFCTIEVQLVTPVVHHSLFQRFLQFFENILCQFPLLKQVFLLLQMCFDRILLN